MSKCSSGAEVCGINRSPALNIVGSSPKFEALYLAQQAVVTTVLRELDPNGGLIAVNGPPGTGKTTLLCDVIADIVAQRGLALAGLKNPWEAFERDNINFGAKGLSVIRSDLFGRTGIVVTSNNNSAVENISKELPNRKKIHKTFGEPDYFKTVSDQMFKSAGINGESWGLIAGTLGSAGKRNAFVRNLFRDYPSSKAKRKVAEIDEGGDPQSETGAERETKQNSDRSEADTLKQILDASDSKPDEWRKTWDESKATLLGLIGEFREERAKLAKVQESLSKLRDLHVQIESADDHIRALTERLAQVLEEHQRRCQTTMVCENMAETALAEAKVSKDDCDSNVILAKDKRELERQANRPSLLERLIRNILGIRTRRFAEWEARVTEAEASLRGELDKLRLALGALENARAKLHSTRKESKLEEEIRVRAIAAAEDQLRSQENQRLRLQAEVDLILALHQELKDRGVTTVPTDDFWKLPPERRHLAHP